MTTLDQAFIKAYQQRGPAQATPLALSQPVTLSDTLADLAQEGVVEGPPGVLTDAVVEAFERPPTAVVPSGQCGRKFGQTEECQDVVGRNGRPAEAEAAATVVPAFVQAGIGAAETPLSIESLGIPGISLAAPEDTQPAAARPDRAAETTSDTEHREAAQQDETSTAEDAAADEGDGVFRPMLQVDSFRWPKICIEVDTSAAEQLDRLADGLLAGLAQGHKVVGVGSSQRGEGCTTLLLSTAKRLAGRGIRSALVDADLADPQLARRLGLASEAGWEAVVAGRLPLEEVLVESIEDRLTLLPLCRMRDDAQNQTILDGTSLTTTFERLRRHYDLVLVDLGALDEETDSCDSSPQVAANRVDAAVLVHDVRSTLPGRLAKAVGHLAAAGIFQAGIIENFVPA